MFITHQAGLAASWQLQHLTKKTPKLSFFLLYSSQKLLLCSGSHRPPRLEHHDHCRRWQRRRQGWVPMRRRCSPPGWLAAGAPDVGSQLKYCFDISVRKWLAIIYPLDMLIPRCQMSDVLLLKSSKAQKLKSSKATNVAKKWHQRNRKEGLTFKISCTLGLSGAFAPGKLT